MTAAVENTPTALQGHNASAISNFNASDFYLAKPQQTIQDIARDTGMSEARLRELNPFIDYDVSEGDSLRLKSDSTLDADTNTQAMTPVIPREEMVPNLSTLPEKVAFATATGSNTNTSVNNDGTTRGTRIAAKLDPSLSLPAEKPGQKSGRTNEDDPVPTRAQNEKALGAVKEFSPQIRDAAKRYKIEPEVIAAIMFEEDRRYGETDRKDDQQAIYNVNNNKAEGGWHRPPGFDLWKASLGRAQMQSYTVDSLIRGNWLEKGDGYGQIPEGTLPAGLIPTKAAYEAMSKDDQYRACAKILLEGTAAPYLIAARARQTAQDYAKRGGDKSILDSSATSAAGVRDSSQYRMLTQLYSIGFAKTPRANLSTNDPMNYRGYDAQTNLGAIRDALYNGKITSFEGWRYGKQG